MRIQCFEEIEQSHLCLERCETVNAVTKMKLVIELGGDRFETEVNDEHVENITETFFFYIEEFVRHGVIFGHRERQLTQMLEKHFDHLKDNLRVVRTGRPATFDSSNRQELEILWLRREIVHSLLKSGKVYTM